MRTGKLVLAVLAIVVTSPTSADAAQGAMRGLWAASGQIPKREGQAETPTSRSPDSKLVVQETPDGWVFTGKKTSLLREILSPPQLTEVVWASNSRAFVINASDGGLVGTWNAFFYSIQADGSLIHKDLYAIVAPQVDRFAACATRERPNIGVSGVLDEGRTLLVIAEVPPHSSCKNMGALVGLRVSTASWSTIEKVDEATLHRTWTDYLGGRAFGP